MCALRHAADVDVSSHLPADKVWHLTLVSWYAQQFWIYSCSMQTLGWFIALTSFLSEAFRCLAMLSVQPEKNSFFKIVEASAVFTGMPIEPWPFSMLCLVLL